MSIDWTNEKQTVMKYIKEDLLTLEAVGKIYGVSRERIRQVIRNVYKLEDLEIARRGEARGWKRILAKNISADDKNYWNAIRFSKPNEYLSIKEISEYSHLTEVEVGWCFEHLGLSVIPPVEERLNLLTDKSKGPNGCWEWIGLKFRNGYGHLKASDMNEEYTHRISWRLANNNQEIPKDKFICHKCNNPGCINPRHLYLGSPIDNINDREVAGNGHFKVGHKGIKEVEVSLCHGDEVIAICESTAKAARLLGVNQSSICNAKNLHMRVKGYSVK